MGASVIELTTAELWAGQFPEKSFEQWCALPDEELPVSKELIEIRAYFLFVQKGRTLGDEFRDWLDAERSLRKEFRADLNSFYLGTCDDTQEEGNPAFSAEPSWTMKWNIGEQRIGRRPDNEALRRFDAAEIEPCDGSQGGVKVDKMRSLKKIHELVAGDPLVEEGASHFRDYHDHVGDLTEAERQAYQGKVLAVLSETGQIIAVADDIQNLRRLIAESAYQGRPWRLIDGPTGKPRVPINEA